MLHELINELLRAKSATAECQLTDSDFRQWKSEFIFEALQDHQYGPSFCRHFNIYDNIIYYSTSVDQVDNYIRNTYIQQ